MKLAFICSIPMLNLVKDEKFHLTLPHLYNNEKYVKFYKKQHNCSKAHIIQDNSVFELKQDTASWELLMKGVREKFVDEIVVPEVLRNSKESLEIASTFVDFNYGELKTSKVKIGAAIQGKSLAELEHHYEALLGGVIGIEVDVVYIPFNFEFDSKGLTNLQRRMSGRARLDLINQMVENGVWDKNVEHHLLGLYNPYELYLYRNRKEWNIRSNDSSSCYQHSLYGVRMIPKVGLPYEKIEKSVDFYSFYKYKEQFDCFSYNVRIIKDFCECG